MSKTYGWQGKMLRLDLSGGQVKEEPTSELADRFIGGRGLLAKIYWDEVDPKVQALDPDNLLVMMSGPLAGTPAIAGSRWIIGGKSPFQYSDQYGLANLGGNFGVKMKSAGIDGIVIKGKAKEPSYIYIEDGKVEIKDARDLWGLKTNDTLGRLKSKHGQAAKSVCIGPAGERLVRFAVVMGDKGSTGGSGFGAVMGSKNLKAVVVKGSGKTDVARPDRLKRINSQIRSLTEGKTLVEPVIEGIEKVRYSHCPGCQVGCARGIYKHISGKEGYLKNCQSSYMYYTWDLLHHEEQTSNLFLAASLCNEYGLCTQEMKNIFWWLHGCREKGIISEEGTGIPLKEMGSMEFMDALVDKLISRDGFGDVLAEGTVRAAHAVGKESVEVLDLHVTKSGHGANAYSPRYFITNAVFYATESTSPMNQLHETVFQMMKWTMWHITEGSMSPFSTEVIRNIAKRFWKTEDAADYSTYDGKAEVASIIQNRGYAKENLVVCDLLYPLNTADGSADHVGDPTLESRMLSAVTGTDFSEDAYYQTGERVFNLERAIQGLEGRAGRKDDVINEHNFTEGIEEDEGYFGLLNPEFELPGPGGEIVSRKGAVLERDKFEKMMDEYYSIRGWDVESGFQKTEKLKELGLSDTIPRLQKRNLVR